MRILVIGAGAVGGYFGARLAQAGKDVTFLVRPGRAADLAARGLRIREPDSQPERIDVATVERVAEPYDIVLLAVKAFALDAAISDFSPAVGPRTTIVPFLNGLAHIDRLVNAFGIKVYGGVCYVATTLTDDGEIVRLGGPRQLRYGPLSDAPTQGADEVHEALTGAGFDSDLSDTIETEMWEKWVFLASVTAVNCLARGTVGDVNAVPGGRDLATAIADEAGRVAAAAGFPPRPEATRNLLATLTEAGASTTSSVYRDLRAGRRVENDAIISDLVNRARDLAVPTPLFAAVDVNLAVYQRNLDS
ncbi:2-dehydropantoate 2-reductase [Asanoa ishikariensis]|uniref:2-dehydropantoate 2-reductase n=1 Tax=Asanoa ishikariensis TaxID=137265 RepID=A0A1H3NJV4_9ACTN|nr:ketopantoate reductase family protein [Asanoa ishikariensis]GIF68567.1 2-dehydropantoate 2-reductase [Asanoa ishikariensis]SDY89162.1 2-dehydropantoate 2-reductase [Asanoa ishikariensis]